MKKNYKLFLTLGFCIAISTLFFTSHVRSDTTEVSGPIVSANWTIAGSPYVVTGDIAITGLIIDPGVSVLFAGNYEFLVSGVIEAVGTEQSQIIFTTKPGVASWKGIRFQNSPPGSFMKWCVVEKANNSGIRIIESFPNLINCTIKNNTASPFGGGLNISNPTPATLAVIDCTFENNNASISSGTSLGGGGVYIQIGNVDFLRCNFINNSVTTTIGSNNISVTGYGGGIAVVNGVININNCTINDNNIRVSLTGCCGTIANALGGGVYMGGGTLNTLNSIITYDTIIASSTMTTLGGAGIYCSGSNTTLIENCTITRNNVHGLYRNGGSVMVINSIMYFNNNSGAQISGTVTATYSDIQQPAGVYPGTGNININPNLDPTCLKILPGSPCIDAGKDSIIYRDACFPPSLGNLRNDMGAHGGPGACNWLYTQDACSTWPELSINIELTALMQGLYNPVTNMMARTQSEILYLRNATCPYAIVEPAAATLGQNGLSTSEFTFNSAPSGTYYLVTRNWNSLETWSKAAGEFYSNDAPFTYEYNFTTAPSQAYGNNLIQIDDSPLRYGIYIGDVSQFGVIDLADVLQVRTSSNQFTTGYNVNDLNGDYQVNLSDLLIAYNNSEAFVAVREPICP